MENDDEDREVLVQALNRELTSADVKAPMQANGYAPIGEKGDHESDTLELTNMTPGSKRRAGGLCAFMPVSMHAGMEKATEKEEENAYTVEDAINHMGFGAFQIVVTLFAGFVWVRAKKSPLAGGCEL